MCLIHGIAGMSLRPSTLWQIRRERDGTNVHLGNDPVACRTGRGTRPNEFTSKFPSKFPSEFPSRYSGQFPSKFPNQSSGQSCVDHRRSFCFGHPRRHASKSRRNGPDANALFDIRHIDHRLDHRRCAGAELRDRSIECAQFECDRPAHDFCDWIGDGNGQRIDQWHQRLCIDQSPDRQAIAGRGRQHRDASSGHHGVSARPLLLLHSLLSRNTFNDRRIKSGQSFRGHVIQRMLMEHPAHCMAPNRDPFRSKQTRRTGAADLESDSKCRQHFQALSKRLKMTRFFVMAGLVPAIHVFLDLSAVRRGCPAQGRA
jgi:hypothetical protein